MNHREKEIRRTGRPRRATARAGNARHASPPAGQLYQELVRLLRRTEDDLRTSERRFRELTTERKDAEEDLRKQKEVLRESEERFRRLVELMPVAVYVCDASGVIRVYNKRAVELWGREPKPGDTVQRFRGRLHLYSPDGTFASHRESPMVEVLRTGIEAREREVVIERPGGSRITVVANIVPLRNGAGELTGAINCFQDITERKRAEAAEITERARAEEELRRSEDRLRLIIDTIPTMAWTIRPDGVIDFINQRWHDYTGLSLKDEVEDPGRAAHPDEFPDARAKWLALMVAGEPFEREMRLRRADGEYRWFLVRVVPLRDERGHIVKWCGTSTEIEDRKRAEDTLRGSFDELRALAGRLQSVREEERARLAREIHDELGQALTAIKLESAFLVRELPGDATQQSNRAASIMKLADETIQGVRRISTELRPGILDDLGLVAAVEWAAEEFEDRTGTKCQLDVLHDDIVIDRPRATALFRILQETLTNVARHANATQVNVRLAKENGSLILDVHDNGKGIGEEELSAGRSLGILGMRERVLVLGGELAISGAPGRGTAVTVRIPDAHRA
jgi:PAS domain S-box-containing protein